MLRQIAALPAHPWRALAALAAAPIGLGLYALATHLRRRVERFDPAGDGAAALYGCALGVAVTLLALFGARQADFFYFRF
jgi:hypothetical protein